MNTIKTSEYVNMFSEYELLYLIHADIAFLFSDTLGIDRLHSSNTVLQPHLFYVKRDLSRVHISSLVLWVDDFTFSAIWKNVNRLKLPVSLDEVFNVTVWTDLFVVRPYWNILVLCLLSHKVIQPQIYWESSFQLVPYASLPSNYQTPKY